MMSILIRIPDLLERAVHLVDRLVQRRCPRSESDSLDVVEPSRVQIIGALDVQGRRLMLVTELNKSTGVVRAASAHDHHGVHTAHEIERRPLS